MSGIRRIIQMLASLALLASLTFMPHGAARANPGTLYVSPDGDDGTELSPNDCMDSGLPCKTIQHAIDQAVMDDTIKVQAGTYTAEAGAQVVLINEYLTLSGGWDEGFLTNDGVSTIDGQAARRGITVNSNVAASVDRFLIQNGSANPYGGGISNLGTLVLSNSTIDHNTAEWRGGGIYSPSSAFLAISASTIRSNAAGSDAGGIYSAAKGTLDHVIISQNRADSDGGGIDGGGFTINDSIIAGNTADHGAGIYGGGLTINNTAISGNRGGGIDAGGTIILNNCTISGNTLQPGIDASYGTLTVNNSTISGNPVGIKGDGTVTITLNNSTVTRNKLGLENAFESHAPFTVRNSIVAGNSDPGRILGPDCYNAVYSAGYNLIGNNNDCKFHPSAGDKIGTSAHPIDARLGSLRDNGGPTRTHALAANSPALNAGNPNPPGSGGNACTATDQRGIDRIAENDCDMGAFEGHFLSVVSIERLDPNPTRQPLVHFKIVFSEPVTGVDLAAPFPDFKLKTTGVTGAAINAAAGSDREYSVTVKTGTGNGSIWLQVVDDDTIVDSVSLDPLGQSGKGNGDYTGDQPYSIKKLPIGSSPKGSTWIRSPTYKWVSIPGATQYQLQVSKGTAVVYTKNVPASVCTSTTCSFTSTKPLTPANLRWRTRPFVGAAAQAWAPYLPFTVIAPKAGFWNAGPVDLYVLPNRSTVVGYAVYIYVYGCGYYKIIQMLPLSVQSGKFAFTGSYYANGAFDNSTADSVEVSGKVGFKYFPIADCGIVSGGPFSWKATWQNGTQPADLAVGLAPIIIMPAPGADNALPVGPAEPR